MDWLFSKSLLALKICKSPNLPFSPQAQWSSLLWALGDRPIWSTSMGFLVLWLLVWFGFTNREHTQEPWGDKMTKSRAFTVHASLHEGPLWVGCITWLKVTASIKWPSPRGSLHTAPPPDSGNCSHFPPLGLTGGGNYTKLHLAPGYCTTSCSFCALSTPW